MHIPSLHEWISSSTYVIPNILETLLGTGSIGYPITDFVINLRITESLPRNWTKFYRSKYLYSLCEPFHMKNDHAIERSCMLNFSDFVKKSFVYQSSCGKKMIRSWIFSREDSFFFNNTSYINNMRLYNDVSQILQSSKFDRIYSLTTQTK